MPQKKNPDIAELARGKSGRFIGNLTAILVTLKGLPFAYNRDLQEDKEPVFDSVEQLLVLIPAVTGMIQTSVFNDQVIASGVLQGHALATEIADFLVRQGVPFAEAHEISGKAVAVAGASGVDVHQLSDQDFAAIDSRLDGSLREKLTIDSAIASRGSINGTSARSVTAQINQLEEKIKSAKEKGVDPSKIPNPERHWYNAIWTDASNDLTAQNAKLKETIRNLKGIHNIGKKTSAAQDLIQAVEAAKKYPDKVNLIRSRLDDAGIDPALFDQAIKSQQTQQKSSPQASNMIPAANQVASAEEPQTATPEEVA